MKHVASHRSRRGQPWQFLSDIQRKRANVTTHPRARRTRTGRPAEVSRWNENRAAGEGVTGRLESGTSVQPACGNDGQGVGVGAGAPLGAEAAGDFAENHTGPQGTLAIVVGRRNVAASDEDEEVAAAFADAAGELLAGLGGRADGEQPVELAVEIGAVLGESSVFQLWTPLADGHGA